MHSVEVPELQLNLLSHGVVRVGSTERISAAVLQGGRLADRNPLEIDATHKGHAHRNEVDGGRANESGWGGRCLGCVEVRQLKTLSAVEI